MMLAVLMWLIWSMNYRLLSSESDNLEFYRTVIGQKTHGLESLDSAEYDIIGISIFVILFGIIAVFERGVKNWTMGIWIIYFIYFIKETECSDGPFYLDHGAGVAVKCGADSKLLCASDGAGCKWSQYGTHDPFEELPDASMGTDPMTISCPGWPPNDGRDPCKVLGCYSVDHVFNYPFYLDHDSGVAVKCGTDSKLKCASDDGVNCKWGKFGTHDPFQELPFASMGSNPLTISCPGWPPKDGKDACTVLACYPLPTEVSLPTNTHDLYCGANNDKPIWTAILSLDQETLNLLHNVKSEGAIKSIQEYIMCSEFIYHAVAKNGAVRGPTSAIKLANEILKLLKQIPGIGDDISDGVNEMSQFIVNLMNVLTPSECSIEWGDEWDPDGTIFNPFEKLEALGDFLSAKVCDAMIGDNLKTLLEGLRDSESITTIKDAFINNMHTFLTDSSNNLFNDALKTELLTNNFYKQFSFAITIGMQICFSKAMNGCITRQHGVSINLNGNTEIFESRSMFVEFPVLSVGISTSGYVHFDLLSNYLDIINKEISLNVGIFANVPGPNTISKLMDLFGEHSGRLDNIPIIGDTAGIGVDFVNGAIEDNPLIVDILTGGANARLSIIYTFSHDTKINCNGFRIALSVGDVDTSFGGGVFFGYEYRRNDVRNIQQNIDWLDDINIDQFGNAVLDLSKELMSIFEDAMQRIGIEMKQIGEDVVDETKSQFVGILNGFLDGFEIIANVGVSGVNGAITALNEGINGVNTGINGAIDGANTAFNGAVSAANTLIDTANTAIGGSNTAINSANSAVNTVSSKFDSANSALTTAKNKCYEIDDNCGSIRVCVSYIFGEVCETVKKCVRDFVSLDGKCNTIFNAVSAPMDLLQDGIDAIPDIPTINSISRISSSSYINNVGAFDNIEPIPDVSISDISAAKQAPLNLNQVIDNDNDIEVIKFDKPDLVITIPSKITSLIFLYTIIIILMGYGWSQIEEKIWMKNGKKHNKERYFSVNDTEISEVSDTDC